MSLTGYQNGKWNNLKMKSGKGRTRYREQDKEKQRSNKFKPQCIYYYIKY